MPKDSFSIVIACEHDADALSATLQAIGELDYPLTPEIIVIDDKRRNRDKAVGDAMGKGMQIRYVEAPHIKTPAAWNFAAQESAGEYVAFLEDGCMPPPGWLMAFKSAFDAWNVGVVGGPERPPKRANSLERSLHYVLTSFIGCLGIRTGGDYIGTYYPRPWNMAARRESVRLAGGFSDKYPESSEVPLVYRMGKIGYKAAFEPRAWVWRYRQSDLLRFIGRSFLVGRYRGHGTIQPTLGSIYAGALALMIFPGAMLLYPGTHTLGRFMLMAEVGMYAVVLALSAMHATVAARTPFALVTVPVLTGMHHSAHMVGYVTGLLGRLHRSRPANR